MSTGNKTDINLLLKRTPLYVDAKTPMVNLSPYSPGIFLRPCEMPTGNTDVSPLLKFASRHLYADAKAPMMALSLYSPRILWKT